MSAVDANFMPRSRFTVDISRAYRTATHLRAETTLAVLMFATRWAYGYSTDVLPVNISEAQRRCREREKNSVYICDYRAGVAELADAQDLGSCGLKTVEVQVLSPAP